jgi:hypothetical protein
MYILKRYIGELLREMPESTKFHILYHGTTSTNAKKIFTQGFDPSLLGTKSGEHHRMPGISFSADYDLAYEHAEWAAEANGDKPYVLEIDASKLLIAPGELYFQYWNESGDSKIAIQKLIDERPWHGVQLFNPETGDGIEEQEVLIFNPNSIKLI